MEYSNTGYVLSGLIIAHETGKPYSDHLRRRIFAPLGMKDTWVGTDEDFPLAREARGYMHNDDDDKPQWDVSGAGDPVDGVWDSTEWFPLSGANAAGDMVSTPRDVVTFLNALFDGRILGPKQLAEDKGQHQAGGLPGIERGGQWPWRPGHALWRYRCERPSRPDTGPYQHHGPR